MSKSLTPKQQRFVQEYLVDPNATQAAIRAGYKQPHSQGPRLLENVGVKAEIDKAMVERAEAKKLSAEWVIEHLMREADYYGEGSTQSARVSALGLLGKHLAMFTDKHSHQVEHKPIVLLPADADPQEYLKNSVREAPAG